MVADHIVTSTKLSTKATETALASVGTTGIGRRLALDTCTVTHCVWSVRKVGRLTQATVVDHIVPHRGDQKLFWDESNWQPLCKPCHDKKTWNEDNNPTYKF